MNSEQTMIFNENMCRTMYPGMVDSIRTLFEYRNKEQGRNFSLGYINSAVILSAHTAELLLKYKIEREGKSFKKNHNLHELYAKLKVESKTGRYKENSIYCYLRQINQRVIYLLIGIVQRLYLIAQEISL